MANFDTLKALIAGKIHDNTEQEITAADVRDSFDETIDAVNGAKQDTISNLATIEAGAAAGATAVQPGALAAVATSGSYADLLGKPTIPAAPGTLQTDLTAAQSTSASEALSGTVKLHKISKTGSYADLNNKPTIPSISLNGSTTTTPSFYAPTGAGTLGQVLTSNGSGAPTWQNAPSGGVQDVTVGGTSVVSGGVAVVPAIPAAPGTLDTTATTAQATNASEALSGSVKLHKVSKTGTYSDLIGTPSLATVATSGSYNDLLNQPTIPAAQVQADWNEADNTKADYIKNKPTIPSAPGTLNTNNSTAQTVSSSEALTGTVKLHKVSKTGTYSDLIGTPTIPSAPGTLNTTATTAQATNASEALSGSVTLHKVAKTGTYSDLIGTPSIPTVPTISTDVAADKADNSKTTGAKAVYDFVKPTTQSSIPAGGLLPGVKYHLGTLSGNVTMALATAGDASVENEYKGDFTAASTAPTITWQGVTEWAGNCLDENTGLPVLTGGKHYEFNIENGYGLIAEFGV